MVRLAYALAVIAGTLALPDGGWAQDRAGFHYDERGRLVQGPAPVEARPGTEFFVTMPLAGMVSRTQERPGVRQTDWLPPGQSIDRAHRVVTIERIAGGAGAAAPVRFISGLTTCLRSCPDGRTDVVGQAPVSGHPAAHVTIDLSPNAANPQPRRVFALAVSGERDLHVITVVIRGSLSRADAEFAEAVLRSVVMCTAGARAPVCQAR